MSVGDPAESVLNRWRRDRDAPGLSADAPAAARALAGLAAALLGFALPVLMVVANKSAPATLAAAALAANAAALLAGRGAALGAGYAALVRAPLARLVLGIVALFVLSFAWTVDPHLTGRGLVEGVPELAFAFALAAAWPLVAGRGDARWLLAGVATAGLLILFEHAAGMPLHALARARGEAWDLKRSAVPPLLLLWPAAALLWPARRFASLAGLVECVPELAFAFALAAAWPLVAGRGDARWLLAGVASAGLLILFEHAAGMPLHALARARGEAWDLKRSAVPPLLLLWPAAALLWPARRFASLAGLVACVVVAVAASHSGAPAAALAVGAALFAAALVVPRAALGLTGIGLAVLIVTAPWTGSILTSALPPDARQELREEHAEHRLAIWTAFEHRGFDRPWLGHGFDASFKVAETARPDGAAVPADSARIVGFHPHDVMLQFWIELGALGLAAASVAFCFAMGRLAPRRGPPLAARLGLLVAVLSVGLVGLSAWQPWWIASVAAALLWFDHGDRHA